MLFFYFWRKTRDASLAFIEEEKIKQVKLRKEDLQKYDNQAIRGFALVLIKTIIWYSIIILAFFFAFNVGIKSLTITINDQQEVNYSNTNVPSVDIGCFSFVKQYGFPLALSIIPVFVSVFISLSVSLHYSKSTTDIEEIKRRVEGQYIIILTTFMLSFTIMKLAFNNIYDFFLKLFSQTSIPN